MTPTREEPQPAELKKGVAEFDSSRRVPALDGLRGIAILAVFFFDYGSGGNQSSIASVRAASKAVGLGWTGVTLFFVLSGFLITGILYDTRADAGYYRKFYARRVLRIFPIYYLASAVIFVVGISLGVHWRAGHLSFLFFCGFPAALIWPSLIQLPQSIHFTHVWSLSVEEQFYAGWPWLIRRMGSKRNVLLACLVMFFVALALRMAFVRWVNPVWAYTFLPCRMDALAVGAALAIAVRVRGAAALNRWAVLVFLLSSVSFVLLCIIRRTVDHNDVAVAIWGHSLVAVSCGALLVMSLGPLSRFFSLSILRMFGRYSYGLYLYTFPLESLLEPLKPRIMAHVGSFAVGSVFYVGACLAINLSIAALSFHFIETPIMRWKSRFRYDKVQNKESRNKSTDSVTVPNGY
jgi:peptidoglycan/LPS O-acetylase OafA/YrhL